MMILPLKITILALKIMTFCDKNQIGTMLATMGVDEMVGRDLLGKLEMMGMISTEVRAQVYQRPHVLQLVGLATCCLHREKSAWDNLLTYSNLLVVALQGKGVSFELISEQYAAAARTREEEVGRERAWLERRVDRAMEAEQQVRHELAACGLWLVACGLRLAACCLLLAACGLLLGACVLLLAACFLQLGPLEPPWLVNCSLPQVPKTCSFQAMDRVNSFKAQCAAMDQVAICIQFDGFCISK